MWEGRCEKKKRFRRLGGYLYEEISLWPGVNNGQKGEEKKGLISLAVPEVSMSLPNIVPLGVTCLLVLL